MSKKNLKKLTIDDTGQMLADNLNRNIKIDHIDFVDHGVRPVDDDYYRFKQEFIDEWGKEKYQQESLTREQQVEDLYHTDWISKRINVPDKP